MTKRGHSVEIIYPKGRGGFGIPDGVLSREVGIAVDNPIASLIVNIPFTVAAVPLCDWLLCSMPMSAFTGYASGKLRGSRMFYYIMNDERALFDDRSLIRSNLLLKAYHRVTEKAHRLPVTIAVNSQWTGRTVCRKNTDSYPVIPHGVDLDVFKPEGHTFDSTDDFIISIVGRRHHWKGLSDLIEALNLVKDNKLTEKNFQLYIITQDELDLSAAKFDARVIKPRDDIEIAAVLRTSNLFVHPSWFEGFGMPPLEAMACGTPCVITDSGGIHEYAKNGENCTMVPPRDPKALAHAIAHVIGNQELREQYRVSGLETAKQFTWDHAADALEQVLSGV
jgi:glycosyltransferase involved in cell wall biosynthesis